MDAFKSFADLCNDVGCYVMRRRCGDAVMVRVPGVAPGYGIEGELLAAIDHRHLLGRALHRIHAACSREQRKRVVPCMRQLTLVRVPPSNQTTCPDCGAKTAPDSKKRGRLRYWCRCSRRWETYGQGL